MRELFLKILEKYNISKAEDFKGHWLANSLRNNSEQIIEQAALIDPVKYKIEGSPGKGNWADIPWIAVFDKDITETATKGYDIVYLFCADMSGVYLSLNQGWTYFKDKYGVKDGRRKIAQVSKAWKTILSSTLSDFSFETIDLNNDNKSTNLAEGYELGHICGKFYSVSDMPSEKKLARDLQNLLGVYRELKGRLKGMSIEKTNDFLIVNSELGLFEDGASNDEYEGIEASIENFEQSILSFEDSPASFIPKGKRPNEFIPRKSDFIEKAKNQKILGLAGELMVLKYEIDFLKKNGKSKLAEKVKHVSSVEGDGAGYDILSFDINGAKKYIEVKTTTGGNETAFNISDNELEFSSINSENYFLYRVFEFDKLKNRGKFYCIQGDLSKKLSLRPQNYIVDGLVSLS